MFFMMAGEAFLAVTAPLPLVDWGIWHCKVLIQLFSPGYLADKQGSSPGKCTFSDLGLTWQESCSL